MVPNGRRRYTKTAPMVFDEFEPCLAWWRNRERNERAWQVDGANLIERDDAGRVIGCNLDVKNPHERRAVDHRTPLEIVDAIIDSERRVQDIADELKAVVLRRLP